MTPVQNFRHWKNHHLEISPIGSMEFGSMMLFPFWSISAISATCCFFPKESTSSVIEPTGNPARFSLWELNRINPVFFFFRCFFGGDFHYTRACTKRSWGKPSAVETSSWWSFRLCSLATSWWGTPIPSVPWLHWDDWNLYSWSWFGVIHGFYPVFFEWWHECWFLCSPKWLQPDGALHLAGSGRFEGPYSPKSPF